MFALYFIHFYFEMSFAIQNNFTLKRVYKYNLVIMLFCQLLQKKGLFYIP